MSSQTSTSQPILNQFVNTVAISSLPTSGGIFGALKYNLNESLGWFLGAPTASDVYLYSDLAFNNMGGYYDIISPASPPLFQFNDTTYSDQILVKAVSNFMYYGDFVIQVNTFDSSDYATQFGKSDGLFNISAANFAWPGIAKPHRTVPQAALKPL